MEYDVFISYSRRDAQIVDQFVRALTDAGFRVWIDRDGIYSGDQFKAKIVKAINNSTIVLFFSSVNSNASNWTVKEISYSLKKGKTIIPIRLDDSEYEDSIDFDLVNIDFIPYNSRQQSRAIDQLKSSIAAQCGKPAAEVTSSPATISLSPEDLNILGLSYYENKNYEQAFEYFKSAAEQGLADAQYNLGVCHDNGQSVTQDYNEAAKWYHKAAEQGHAKAQYELGICYMHGCGVTKDYNEAVKWYRKAAEQGHADAQNNLGNCYFYGEGIQQDYNEAVKWYRKAAEQGQAKAQYILGRSYEYGWGVSQDDNEAVKWCRKAAEQGLTDAQYDLGHRYCFGEGIQQDYNEAAKWYRIAAEQGHAKALYYLGVCYQKSWGVPQDDNEAVKWYRKAAEQGHEHAIKALKKLGKY